MNANWQLNEEYYQEWESPDLCDVVEKAGIAESGQVFLEGDGQLRFSFEFNNEYGVCEFDDQINNKYLFALTDHNLTSQIPSELHLVQSCPCCGVGMLWYSSRNHMPRDIAFSILKEAVATSDLPRFVSHSSGDIPVSWVDLGDISYNERGVDGDPKVDTE